MFVDKLKRSIYFLSSCAGNDALIDVRSGKDQELQ
jgi:hypothetical protein